MKKLIVIGLFVIGSAALGQEFDERIAIPLSSPGERGELEIDLVRGNIFVTAYDGEEVIIHATASSTRKTSHGCDECDDDDDNDYAHREEVRVRERTKRGEIPEGMKRISSSPIELSATEEDNRIEVETNSWKKPIDLTISLPSNFDLELSTVHGRIEVEGVGGSHEISSVNGPLTFENMEGSIISNSVNGAITANFLSVYDDEPMSFITLNGTVDVTFPSDINATAKMRSDRGEIYTDFDMTVDRSKPEVRTDDGSYRVSVNSWVFGDINDGGPEYTFKNMNGSIIIRKD